MTQTPPGDGSAPHLPVDMNAALKRYSGWFRTIGLVWLVLGIVAVSVPHLAAVAFDVMFGVLLLLGGLAQIVQSLCCVDWRGKILMAFGGLLALAAGGALLARPAEGTLTLTMVLSLFFVIAGAVRLVLALQHRGQGGWFALAVSGVIGIGVGAVIWYGLPGTGSWVLGLVVGIELIVAGGALLRLGNGARG